MRPIVTRVDHPGDRDRVLVSFIGDTSLLFATPGWAEPFRTSVGPICRGQLHKFRSGTIRCSLSSMEGWILRRGLNRGGPFCDHMKTGEMHDHG